ncbi:hypothetical protein [Galbibacter pacificus]|uniref:Phage morphogenesis protein n=1 Tax=Galbibacter pacificus TaxID=2996052 RepID=A0ABT6FQD9_9FLAO|nr:hypothetical protein [Galbibacter pacificus]MDG3582044.1 hypothetical protein [Galbibacter pacificus]MDG3585482.1 hypothetical protein [Galbibacter pacificus]
MLIPNNTKKALSQFAQTVVRESKSNVSKVSKKLYNSIDYDLRVHKQSFSLSFEMEEYGQYQDKGVSGTKKKYDTEYKYTTKRPPLAVFDKWIVKKKGIAPRDNKGKFQSRKSLQYLLSKSIFEQGIKPSLFFTKPFEKAFKDLDEEVIEAFALDTDKFLKQTLKK